MSIVERDTGAVWECRGASKAEQEATVALWRSWGIECEVARRGRPRRSLPDWAPAAAEYYRSGASLADCSARFKVNVQRVRTALRSQGVQLRSFRTRLSRLADDEIVRRYQAGENATAIAITAKISRERVRQILTCAGIKLRSPSQVNADRREARAAEIMRLAEAGETYSDIALAVGCSSATVENVLRACGRLKKKGGPTWKTRRAIEMFDGGASLDEIVLALGYGSVASLRAMLHRHGRSEPRRKASVA